ncbi:MAG: transglycosylase domain-containing protein, partial [Alphaproteobacteria bacterium]|nr:transglycosylase domain-containing protein [Alphaproteobacteria bacterium]
MRLPRIVWLLPITLFFAIVTIVVSAIRTEMRTSETQAEWLSWYGAHIQFTPGDGPNPAARFPVSGPYNQRLGYSYIPFFAKSLQADDYHITQQMRATPTYDYFFDRGLYPIYHAKTVAGVTLYDRDEHKLYSASYPAHVFADFASIPPVLVNTLLYIENRELLRDGAETRNPVIEWDRFLYALVGHAIHSFAPGFNPGGGSTLATQIEKFRYSPGGQTTSGMEKLRQIASASLRVYLDGPDTRAAREKIALDYLNSTPLSARPGFGEINSIGDGLWAWFGIDLNDAANALNLPEHDADSLRTKAQIYREALGLILAQRRPSYYLASNHTALDALTDATLDRLAEAGVISVRLRDTTKAANFHFVAEAPLPPQPPFMEQKAVNALRSHLMSMLGLKKLYEIDRLDLTARSTLDQDTQSKLVDFLRHLSDPDFLKANGLYGFRLLNPDNDPKKIKWSVVLYERTNDSNKLRVQADNIDEPFDMNEGMKLDLGSTAKLRTLVSYLEIISELYRRYAGLSVEDLQDMAEDAPDVLTEWAIGWLIEHPTADLETMLNAAMDRHYSGNPHEIFFTGGGQHTFVNFERSEDFEVMDLHEAFRNSVNLVFVRLMRDIVNYTIAQGPQTKEQLLDDPDEPARKSYLDRFADQEGAQFLNRYISEYFNLDGDAALEKLLSHAHKGASAHTIIFRSVRPQASITEFADFMQRHPLKESLSNQRLAQLYHTYTADKYNLSDRGYIAGLNPMELWLVSYLQSNPHASRHTLMQVSQPIRIASYAWLMNPHLKRAQDTRIRIILEADAFAQLHDRWARLGYPFGRLVPSLATAIGSSADRPGALAELVGIILNDGTRLPTIRFESLMFGEGTPYQTLVEHYGDQHKEQLLDPAIAHVMKGVMAEVVDNGTARRVKGAYKDTKGTVLTIGGKTGTGDHRFDEFGTGGHLISSRVVNRTGTFAFYIGDHFFGTITAHVAGEEAAKYKFTSALSAQ